DAHRPGRHHRPGRDDEPLRRRALPEGSRRTACRARRTRTVNALLVAPLLLVVAGIAAGWFLPRVASPAASVRVLTAATVVAAAGVAAALVLVTAAGASELHEVSSWLGWCDALYPGDHGAAPWA